MSAASSASNRHVLECGVTRSQPVLPGYEDLTIQNKRYGLVETTLALTLQEGEEFENFVLAPNVDNIIKLYDSDRDFEVSDLEYVCNLPFYYTYQNEVYCLYDDMLTVLEDPNVQEFLTKEDLIEYDIRQFLIRNNYDVARLHCGITSETLGTEHIEIISKAREVALDAYLNSKASYYNAFVQFLDQIQKQYPNVCFANDHVLLYYTGKPWQHDIVDVIDQFGLPNIDVMSNLQENAPHVFNDNFQSFRQFFAIYTQYAQYPLPLNKKRRIIELNGEDRPFPTAERDRDMSHLRFLSENTTTQERFEYRGMQLVGKDRVSQFNPNNPTYKNLEDTIVQKVQNRPDVMQIIDDIITTKMNFNTTFDLSLTGTNTNSGAPIFANTYKDHKVRIPDHLKRNFNKWSHYHKKLHNQKISDAHSKAYGRMDMTQTFDANGTIIDNDSEHERFILYTALSEVLYTITHQGRIGRYHVRRELIPEIRNLDNLDENDSYEYLEEFKNTLLDLIQAVDAETAFKQVWDRICKETGSNIPYNRYDPCQTTNQIMDMEQTYTPDMMDEIHFGQPTQSVSAIASSQQHYNGYVDNMYNQYNHTQQNQGSYMPTSIKSQWNTRW